MEAYSSRLLDGTYRIASLLDDGDDGERADPSRGICLFPAKKPEYLTTATRGVEVSFKLYSLHLLEAIHIFAVEM